MDALGRTPALLKRTAMGETFGQRMRRLRGATGISVPELASAVGASEGTIRQLEAGQKRATHALG